MTILPAYFFQVVHYICIIGHRIIGIFYIKNWLFFIWSCFLLIIILFPFCFFLCFFFLFNGLLFIVTGSFNGFFSAIIIFKKNQVLLKRKKNQKCRPIYIKKKSAHSNITTTLFHKTLHLQTPSKFNLLSLVMQCPLKIVHSMYRVYLYRHIYVGFIFCMHRIWLLYN